MTTIFPWQNEIWQHLLAAYQQDRLPHALLFLGQQGIGKIQFAKSFSQFLICQNKTVKEKKRLVVIVAIVFYFKVIHILISFKLL